MSADNVRLMSLVSDHAFFKPRHKEILCVLADHGTSFSCDEAIAHPSQALIASKVGLSERQVRRLIKELEVLGVLLIERAYISPERSFNKYVINLRFLRHVAAAFSQRRDELRHQANGTARWLAPFLKETRAMRGKLYREGVEPTLIPIAWPQRHKHQHAREGTEESELGAGHF